MTRLRFSFYSVDGGATRKVRMFIHQPETDWDDRVRDANKALADAIRITEEIAVGDARDPDDRLVLEGEPPDGALLVFDFHIGLVWDNRLKIMRYRRGDYTRHLWDPSWAMATAMGMELHRYIYGVLKKWERKAEKEAAGNGKPD